MKKVKLPATKKIKLTSENSTYEQKIELRKWLLKELGIKNPKVLDAYCASGKMWEHAYDKTKNYVGLDINRFHDDRETIQCDNSRYLRQVDVNEFDVFDLDAYGSPMECFAIITSRLNWKNKTKVGFALTDGTGFNAKMNSTSKGYLDFLGLKESPKIKSNLDYRDDLIKLAIIKGAEICGADIGRVRVYFKNKGSYMRYIAFVFSRKKEPRP